MAKRLTDVELDAFKEALLTIVKRGNEAELRSHIDTFFPRLPEEMQNEIVAGLFLTAQNDEANDLAKEMSA